MFNTGSMPLQSGIVQGTMLMREEMQVAGIANHYVIVLASSILPPLILIRYFITTSATDQHTDIKLLP